MNSRNWNMATGWWFALAAIVGCGESNPAKKEPSKAAATPSATAKETPAAGRIVFITNSDSTFWDAAEKGAMDAGQALGAPVTFLRNKSADAAGQIALIEQVSAQRDVRSVVVSVVNASAIGIIDKLAALKEKGIAVITFDSDTGPKDRAARLAYVGTNNFEAGKVAGSVALKLAPAGGKVVAFVGDKDADNARQRVDGFKAGAGEKFTLIDVMTDGGDRVKARANVETAILRHKDLVMPFGIYSYNAPAIAAAVADKGKRDQLKVLTFDAEDNTMKAIEAGGIDATIVQNTYDMGYMAAKLVHAFASKDQMTIDDMLKGKDQFDTGVRVIVPNASSLKGAATNIQTFSEFADYMKQKGLKST